MKEKYMYGVHENDLEGEGMSVFSFIIIVGIMLTVVLAGFGFMAWLYSKDVF